MCRVLKNVSQRFTKVTVLDKPGSGGACHIYEIVSAKAPVAVLARVDFQNGPVKEAGVNGCHNEDLLAIVLDRLESFQAGEFRCRENAIVVTKIEEALHWLNHRTKERADRGVEGTSAK